AEALNLPLLTALALRSALQAWTDRPLLLKWPNDLLLGDTVEKAKLAGILVELVGDRAVIGFGVNVYPPTIASADGSKNAATSQNSATRPPGWLLPAQSDSAVVAEQINCLGTQLIQSLLDYLQRWQAAGIGFAGFQAEYQSYLGQFGQSVEVRDQSGQLLAAGVVQGVDDHGRLILATRQGEQFVTSGEVTLRFS
ncbi:MAG: hypothetical protein FWC59_01680, partial [Actinomycetia bacterium]|nr:hypothetical protein [Actinomycetes bacterium]